MISVSACSSLWLAATGALPCQHSWVLANLDFQRTGFGSSGMNRHLNCARRDIFQASLSTVGGCSSPSDWLAPKTHRLD